MASYRRGERPQEKATQLTPFSRTFGLQNREDNCEINSFLLFRPPTLQSFVRAVPADEQQAPCKLSHHLPSCLLRGLGKGQPCSDAKGGRPLFPSDNTASSYVRSGSPHPPARKGAGSCSPTTFHYCDQNSATAPTSIPLPTLA